MSFRYITGEILAVEQRDALARVPTHHLPWCFGCGPENEHGLGVRPHFNGDFVEAEIQFAPRFQGGPGVVHGGAVAAFFDDLMGFVMMAHQRPAVTAKLETNYLRPIPLGLSLRGKAWLAKRDGRKMWVEASGEDDRGRRYVEALALFIPVGLEHFRQPAVDPERAARMSRYESDEYYP